MQGARLTSYELHDAGADVTVICDNMAASVMKQGDVYKRQVFIVNFCAQIAHIDVDDVGIGIILILPDIFEQLFTDVYKRQEYH